MAPGETFAGVSRGYTLSVTGICLSLWLLQVAMSGPARQIVILLAVVVTIYLLYFAVATRLMDRLREFMESGAFDKWLESEDEPEEDRKA